MRVMNKTSIALILVLLVAVTVWLPIQADAEDNLGDSAENIGVTELPLYEINDSQIQDRGASKPTVLWDISKKGQYSFKGTSTSGTIYTSYKFTGKSSYVLYIKNSGNTPLAITVKGDSTTVTKRTMETGKSGYLVFETNKPFYVAFKGASFSGYIK